MNSLISFFLIVALMFPAHAWGAWTESERAELPSKNLLKDQNPGFENGKARWSSSGGTVTSETSQANVYTGNRALSWDPSATSQVLSSSAATSKTGASGSNGVGACWLRTTATDIVMSVSDGSGTVGTRTVTPSSTYQLFAVNFIFTSNVSNQIVFTSASDSAAIYIDDCFLGPAEGFNFSQVSQAEMYGYLKYANTTNCVWVTGDTGAAFTEFPADTDCPAPTTAGYASAPSTKVPRIKFASLPPGEYMVVVSGRFTPETGGVSADLDYKISDGTNTSGYSGIVISPTSGTTSRDSNMVGRFTYTAAQTNIEFRPVASSSSNSNDPAIQNGTNGAALEISVYRFPLSSQQAYRPDQMANSWSGYHTSTNCGAWARTNTAYGDPAADADCNLTERTNTNFGSVTSYLSGSDELPGIVFTPSRAQKYWVCAILKITGATTGADINARLWDGTTVITEGEFNSPVGTYIVTLPLCGEYSASSVAAKTLSVQTKASSGAVTILANSTNASAIEWSIFAIDQQLPAPLLVNSVLNTSSGVTRIEAAKLNCDAAAAITSQHGSWISSIGNISSGTCSITITSGTFSSTPYCWAQWDTGGSNTIVGAFASSATAAAVFGGTDAGAADTAFDAQFFCVGAK